jgi:hypothetical protein
MIHATHSKPKKAPANEHRNGTKTMFLGCGVNRTVGILEIMKQRSISDILED